MGGEKNRSSRLLAVESCWLFLLKPTVGQMKGHLLVSHYILEHSAQTQVFGSTGPVFGVNENSILSVSQQNFQEKGGNLYLRPVALVTRTPLFPSIDYDRLSDSQPGFFFLCETESLQCWYLVRTLPIKAAIYTENNGECHSWSAVIVEHLQWSQISVHYWVKSGTESTSKPDE